MGGYRLSLRLLLSLYIIQGGVELNLVAEPRHAAQDEIPGPEMGSDFSSPAEVSDGATIVPHKAEQGIWVDAAQFTSPIELEAEQVHHALLKIGQIVAASHGEG